MKNLDDSEGKTIIKSENDHIFNELRWRVCNKLVKIIESGEWKNINEPTINGLEIIPIENLKIIPLSFLNTTLKKLEHRSAKSPLIIDLFNGRFTSIEYTATSKSGGTITYTIRYGIKTNTQDYPNFYGLQEFTINSDGKITFGFPIIKNYGENGIIENMCIDDDILLMEKEIGKKTSDEKIIYSELEGGHDKIIPKAQIKILGKNKKTNKTILGVQIFYEGRVLQFQIQLYTSGNKNNIYFGSMIFNGKDTNKNLLIGMREHIPFILSLFKEKKEVSISFERTLRGKLRANTITLEQAMHYYLSENQKMKK